MNKNKLIIASALALWVAFVDKPHSTNELPGVLALLVCCFFPRFGLLYFIPNASSGVAQLVLTIIDPEFSALALAIAADYQTNNLLFFILICVRVVASSFISKIKKRILIKLIKFVISKLNPTDSLRERSECVDLLCGVSNVVNSSSTISLISARKSLLTSMEAIESLLLSSNQPPQQQIQKQTGPSDCSICMSEPAIIVLRPCLHSVLCLSCFQQLKRTTSLCPLCRLPFLDGQQSSNEGDEEGCSTSSLHFAVSSVCSQEDFQSQSRNYTKQELKRLGIWKDHKKFLQSINEESL